MNDRTLNEYIGLLKTVQQEYIVFCVREHSDIATAAEFHRGLLPFLRAEEAARCLKVQQARLMDTDSLPRGSKFIRGIISIFENALVHRLCEDEETVIMTLSPMKLQRYFRRNYGDHIVFQAAIIARAQNLVELKRKPGTHQWKVTAHKERLPSISTWLAETFR